MLSAYIDLRWRLIVQCLMKPLLIVKQEVRAQVAHGVCHALVILDIIVYQFSGASIVLVEPVAIQIQHILTN